MIFGNSATKPPPLLDSRKKSPIRAPAFAVADDGHRPPTRNFQGGGDTTDSGYHGLSEDEFKKRQQACTANINPNPITTPNPLSQQSAASLPHPEDRSTAERSFHSAREQTSNQGSGEDAVSTEHTGKTGPLIDRLDTAGVGDEAAALAVEKVDKDGDEDLVGDGSQSASQNSTPERPVIRKSSLTFAGLPAREPLKRISQTENSVAQQSTFLGRITGGKSIGGYKAHPEIGDLGDANRQDPEVEGSDGDSKLAKLHNKSSTQRLHERINQLGQAQTHLLTKSIPAAQPLYPELKDDQADSADGHQPPSEVVKVFQPQPRLEEEDDWIQPPPSNGPPKDSPPQVQTFSAIGTEKAGRGPASGDQAYHHSIKAQTNAKVSSPLPASSVRNIAPESFRVASDSQTESPGIYASYNGVKTFDEGEARKTAPALSTTPAGSPLSHRYVENPLSASRSKLQSIMKTARGLFSSSAGVSAQARMETLADGAPDFGPRQLDSAGRLKSEGSRNYDREPAALGEKCKKLAPEKRETLPSPRKTRSSTEKGNQERRQQANDRDNYHEAVVESENYEVFPETTDAMPHSSVIEAQLPSKDVSKPTRKSPRRMLNQESDNIPSHGLSRSGSRTQARAQQLQRSKEPRRPVRPPKDAGPKPKPQPVAIRVGMPSTHRAPLNNTALSSNLSEALPPSKQPRISKKPTLQHSASNSSLKSSVASATTKPRALLAAERKREQVGCSRIYAWLEVANTLIGREGGAT